MSYFSNALKELLDESKMDFKTLAKEVGISASRITDYMRNDKLPNMENLIKIADYFNCSTDFLLGREYASTDKTFCTPPPFSQRLQYLRKLKQFKHIDIYGKGGITKSRYFDWLNGSRQPSVDNLLQLANIFDCSVDFLIGREK